MKPGNLLNFLKVAVIVSDDEKTQFLLEKALRGEPLTKDQAQHVARVAQENTEFRRDLQKVTGNIKKVGMAALALILTNFFNDFFGHLIDF